MVPDALRIYIKESITSGQGREAIRAALISAGWAEADVAAAFIEHDAPHTPQVSTPDTPVQTLPQSSSQFSAMTAQGVGGSSSKKIMITVIAVVFGVLVLGGGAAAYMMLFKAKELSPEVVILNMHSAMKDIHSAQSVMNMGIKLTATPDASPNSPALSEPASAGKLDMRLIATGSAIIGATATSTNLDLIYALSGNAGYGPFSMDLDSAVEMRVVKGIAYVKAVKLPQIISMFAPGSVSAFSGKWISVDPTSSSTIETIESAGIGTSSNVLAPSDEERKRAQEMLVRNWPFVIASVKEKTPPMLDGQPMYHFRYTLDQVKLRALFADSIDLESGAKQLSDEEKKMSKEMSGQMATFFASSSGELYIGKSDAYLHRATWVAPVDIATSSVHVVGNIDLDILMSNFNTVAPILTPTDARPLQQVLDELQQQAAQTQASGGDVGVLGSLEVARSKSRDAKRISDLGQLQLAEELYFDAHQKYSVTLDSLYKEQYIPAIPVDPGTGNQSMKPKAYLYSNIGGLTQSFENAPAAVTLDTTAYLEVQNALGKYYAKYKKYPATLSLLTKEHLITKTPVHTSSAFNYKTEVQYVYKQQNNGMSYQLGASLERADSAVLETDADGKLNGKNTNFGADALGCKNEMGRYCYDIAP